MLISLNLSSIIKKNVKLSRYTPRRRLGERIYSSYSFPASALEGGESSVTKREYNPLRADPVHVTEQLVFQLTDLEEMTVLCIFVASLNYLANKFTCLTVDNSVSFSCPLF
jgi:hypothetical protein